MKGLINRVSVIQLTLKAPKGQYNTFGKYSYRNCEDIVEAVKPLLGGLVLTISDELQAVGDRVYIKATATLTDGEHSISNSAFAREAATKKGMDEAQITGGASSYARKYALNGLFCIDDNKDADSQDSRETTSANNGKSYTTKPHPVEAVAAECGYSIQDVFNTFQPAIKSLSEIPNVTGCIQFLRQNARTS